MNKSIEQKITRWARPAGDGEKFQVVGGEVLKHVGSEMIYAEFNRENAESEWIPSITQTKIEYIGDYDPMTGTYLAKHETREGRKVEERIMSAGFKYGNPEEMNYTSRLIPFSLHYKLQEENLYYDRLGEYYRNNTGVLPLEIVQGMSRKEAREALQHILWIAFVIDTDTKNGIKRGILSSRITEVVSVDRRARSWSVIVRDEAGTAVTIDKFKLEEDGTWVCRNFSIEGEIIGDLKILDIECPPLSNSNNETVNVETPVESAEEA